MSHPHDRFDDRPYSSTLFSKFGPSIRWTPIRWINMSTRTVQNTTSQIQVWSYIDEIYSESNRMSNVCGEYWHCRPKDRGSWSQHVKVCCLCFLLVQPFRLVWRISKLTLEHRRIPTIVSGSLSICCVRRTSIFSLYIGIRYSENVTGRTNERQTSAECASHRCPSRSTDNVIINVQYRDVEWDIRELRVVSCLFVMCNGGCLPVGWKTSREVDNTSGSM